MRGNLQLLLKELGDGFQRYGGAEGLRQFNLTGGPAYKNTALVNEAFLGTEPGDLSGLVENFDRVFVALNRNQTQLQDLVTNLRIVTGSFAAEGEALEASIRQLPGVLDAAEPVFANLNTSFPPLRAFAREALPGVRSSGPTIDAALPFVRQLQALVSPSELRGLTADLRPTIPQLAKLTSRQVPFLEQARAVSSCFTNVIIPWSSDEVGDGETDGAGDVINPVYQETAYGLVGIGGESRSGDANGQYIRVGAGGGTNTVLTTTGVGVTPFPLEGTEPALGPKTPYRPDVPCETQEQPDMRSEIGPAPSQSSGSGQTIFESAPNSRQAEISREAVQLYSKLALANSAAAAVDSRSERRRFLAEYGDLMGNLQRFTAQDLPEFERLQRGLGG